jgi:endonuclease/exonuclease/phosphatase (EEP) superfamily protein YafD
MNTDTLHSATPSPDRPDEGGLRRQNALAGLIIVLTVGMLGTSYVTWLKPFASYAVHAAVLLLALGLVFFITNRTRLMFTALLCCGALSLFLKSSANQRLRFGGATDPPIRFAHVTLGDAEGDYDTVIAYLQGTGANLLSVQELTPDWEDLLRERLRERFPYQAMLTRIDQYGSGLLSALPFDHLDTLWFEDIPALVGTFDAGDGVPTHVITAQVIPPVNPAAYTAISAHLGLITAMIRGLPGHVLVGGDFHLPPWSSEVLQFKAEARLEDSRRDVHTRNLDGSASLPRVPVDHILYGHGLECASFANLGNEAVGRLGIYGAYYPKEPHAPVAQ